MLRFCVCACCKLSVCCRFVDEYCPPELLLASANGDTAYDMNLAGEVFVYGLILALIAGSSEAPFPSGPGGQFPMHDFLHGSWMKWIVVSTMRLKLYMYMLHAC